MPRSTSRRRKGLLGLGLIGAVLVGAGALSPLRAEEKKLASEGVIQEYLLVVDENPALQWREAKYNIGFTALMINDVNRETGMGLEISGPDPFRDLDEQEKKLVPNWRVGANFFSFADPITGNNTDLTIYTLAIGADYYFKRSTKISDREENKGEIVPNPSLFLSSFLTYYGKDRSGGNPNRTDDDFGALNMGFGWAGPKFRFRYDHSFLEGGGQTADTFGIGYTF